jgi:hypothetical protein
MGGQPYEKKHGKIAELCFFFLIKTIIICCLWCECVCELNEISMKGMFNFGKLVESIKKMFYFDIKRGDWNK